ncbi:MAG TPA: hypothetical protein VFN55_11120 [Solirubrobacteraceae bacterium]|nr:hypothetical protein [Solirubrobacteraceae bacterium]
MALFVVLLLVAGCGGSSASSSSSGSASRQRAERRARAAAARPDVFVFRHLYSLPAPLRDPAFAALGGSRFVLAGGLSAADVSTDEVDIADLHRVVRSGTLPAAQHDAQGAGLPSGAYVFGGGNASEYDHIYKINAASATASTAGRLPTVASDVAVTQVGSTAYVVGGYDGTRWLNTVVAWSPGHGARVVGHLPLGLRYAAVTPGPIGQLVVIGGTTPSGGASRSVFIFNPATGHSRVLATLRRPVTHAGAVTVGNFAYLIGGRSASSTGQTSSIWSINTATGKLRAAGHLPAATSDAAVLRVGNAVIVAGGQTSRGVTLAEVGRLIPAP